MDGAAAHSENDLRASAAGEFHDPGFEVGLGGVENCVSAPSPGCFGAAGGRLRNDDGGGAGGAGGLHA